MKICNKCMEQNEDTANFCLRCRAPFDSAGTATCPRGHIIDPTWTECPYCRAEQSSSDIVAMQEPGQRRKETVVEKQAGPPPPPPPPFSQSLSGPPKPLESSGSQRRKTVYAPPPAPAEEAAQEPAGAQKPRAPERRVVGVLVTYSWKPEGQVFAVREGRNLIGRGAECEICVPEDPTLSNVNSHITYRKNFVVGDMVSMSGTDLNGEPVEDKFVLLPNYATLRTGSTHWTFIVIQPQASESAAE
jgi:hypothetical protein